MNFFRLSKAGVVYIRSKKGREERERERERERGKAAGSELLFTHEHGYSQTETVNALASTAQRGPFLSRQKRPSWTVFGHRSKVWTLGA